MSETTFVIIGSIVLLIMFIYHSPRGRWKQLDFMYPKEFRMAQDVFREKVVCRLGKLDKKQLKDVEEYVIALQFEKNKNYYLDTKIQYRVFDTTLDWLLEQLWWQARKNVDGIITVTEKGKAVVEGINSLMSAPSTLTGFDQETKNLVQTKLLELLPPDLLDKYSELKVDVSNKRYLNAEQNKKKLTNRQAQQCLGMDVITSKADKFTEIFIEEDFACFSMKVKNRQAIIFSKTYMYPAKYDNLIEEEEDCFIHYLSKLNKKLVDSSDVYMVGVGAIKKSATTDKEKGEFIPGEKYLLYASNFKQIKCSQSDNSGFSITNPILLSMVSDEYYFMEHLQYSDGIILEYDRKGSVYKDDKEDTKPMDEWFVVVEDPDGIRYEYKIFLDPYAVKIPKRPDLDNLKMPFGFAFKQ